MRIAPQAGNADGEQPFLTTAEVEATLRVKPRTIYRLIRIGDLPAVRVGRQWRFRRSDLDRWLESQRQGFGG
jgi:excisionase family DNA binding protein